jgi:hypothetical protein
MNNLMYYVFAGFVAFGFAVGIPVGRWSVHCPVCHQIVPVSTTTTTTISQKPAETVTGDTTGVRVILKPVIRYVDRIIHDTTVKAETKIIYRDKKADTEHCWTWIDKFKNGASAAQQICSRELSINIPSDFFHQISMNWGYDTSRITNKLQNVIIPPSRFALIVGPYAGVGYNAFDFAWQRPQINFGVCLSAGWKLR